MRSCLAIALLLALCACSGSKQAGPDEVRSYLKEARSTAVETVTFLDYVRQGRATRNYARGYVEDLQQHVDQQTDELRKAQPAGAYKATVDRCRHDLNALRGELDRIPLAFGDNAALGDIAVRVAGIRDDLNIEETRR